VLPLAAIALTTTLAADSAAPAGAASADPAEWTNDLAPIAASDWTPVRSVMAPTMMAKRFGPDCARHGPLELTDPMALHIAAIHQSGDANVCDRNQNSRPENQGKHSLGRR